jgi:hypothetical protein
MVRALPLFFLILLAGCANQIKVKTPATHFITSETHGEFGKGDVLLHQLSGAEGTFDFETGGVDEELKLGGNSDAFGATGNLGIFYFLDAVYKTGTHNPEMYGVKMQVKGESRMDAKKGDESWSILFMGGGSKYETNDGDNIGIVLSPGADMTFKRTHTVIHFGLLYGKRIEDYLLLYGHYAESHNTVHGEIDYEGNALDGEQVRYFSKIHNYTFGTKFEDKELDIYGEIALQDIKWTFTERQYIYSLGLGVGIRWD